MEIPENETCVSEMTEDECSSIPTKKRRNSANSRVEVGVPAAFVHSAMQNEDQLLSGGVNTIINALSVPNPGARDFAALALILLTSQGGYEVKSLVAEAGAIPLLIRMAETGSYVSKELAAGAIASLVSLHPGNRLAVIRLGGLKALVNMAKAACSCSFSDGNEMMKARIQTAAAVAVLNLSEAFDRCEVMGIEGALHQAATLLENGKFATARAGLGGLQAITSSISVGPKLSFELVSALLDVTKSSSQEARISAIQELESLCSTRGAVKDVRRDGVNLFLWLLDNFSTLPGLPEAIVRTFSRNTHDGSLSDFISETDLVPRLLRLVSECQSLSTSSLAMCCIANLGARNKQLVELRNEGVTLIVRILGSDSVKFEKDLEMACSCMNSYFQQQHAQGRLELFNAHVALREHAAATLVYFALSGAQQKKEIVAAGAIPVLVKLVETRFVPSKATNGSSSSIFQATLEFAVMVLIVLADKAPSTAEIIVQAGGIPVFLGMVASSGCGDKFGAPWSEMAAAALLTMAEAEAARSEMIKCNATQLLLQVLRGDNKVSDIGAAAMVQLLGIFATSGEETKLELTRTGAARCVADVLGQSSESVVEEAAVSALANLSLDSPQNAVDICEAAGAVESLVRLLDPAELGSEKSRLKLGAALVVVCNMINCCDVSKEAVLRNGGAEKLRLLLNSQTQSELQEVDSQKLRHVLELLTTT